MMLHPGILALTVGSGLSLLLLFYACRLAARILLRWEPGSSAEGQLQLEREADLVATLVRCALGFEVVALLLFLYTVDDIHPLFVGAMCATGTLNLDPAGWQALGARIVICFGAGLWLALEFLDRRAEDAPLVRRKYQLLLVLAPLVAAGFWFQTRFFLSLQPEVITSCCGSLFGAGSGVAAELASLPVQPTMAVFYSTLLLFLLAAGLCLRLASAWPRYLLALAAAATLPVALAAIVSFVSLYIYELPTHHCPFDILQREYRYVGYPLYLSLFGAVHYGWLPGICRPLRRFPSLAPQLRRSERRWLLLAIVCLLLFTGLASWPVVMGPFTLTGYE